MCTMFYAEELTPTEEAERWCWKNEKRLHSLEPNPEDIFNRAKRVPLSPIMAAVLIDDRLPLRGAPPCEFRQSGFRCPFPNSCNPDDCRMAESASES